MSDPTDPPDVQAAREALAAADRYTATRQPGAMSGVVERHHLRATLAHLDTLTARLAVVEGERDAAAATERAAIVAWLRSDTAQEPGMHRPALDNAALRIESNAHHEAP